MFAAQFDPETRTLVYVLLGVFALIAVVILKGGQFLVRRWRDGRQKWVPWESFPAEYGLTLTSTSENGTVHEGRVEGFKVLVKRGSGQAPQDDRKLKPVGRDYACIAVQCAKPQPVGLQLWRETEHDAVRKETRKLNEVIVGDDELDQTLIIRGKQAAEIKALICQPRVRAALLKFFGRWPMAIATDHWVKCESLRDTDTSPREMLESALELAKALDNAAR